MVKRRGKLIFSSPGGRGSEIETSKKLSWGYVVFTGLSAIQEDDSWHIITQPLKSKLFQNQLSLGLLWNPYAQTIST